MVELAGEFDFPSIVNDSAKLSLIQHLQLMPKLLFLTNVDFGCRSFCRILL